MATINPLPPDPTAVINQSSPLLPMPVDVVTKILTSVLPQDIASFNLVCRHFHQIFTLDSVWQNLLENHFRFYRAPKEIEDFQKSYKAQYRFESNFKKGVFCLKSYTPHEGDAVSFQIAHGKSSSSIWNTPKGTVKIKLGNDGIGVYDSKTNKLLHTLVGHGLAPGYAAIVDVLVAENKLFSASGDGTVKIWNLETGECVNTIRLTQPGPFHTAGVQSLAIDKNKLFAGCYDNSIKILDMETGEILNQLNGHTSAVYCLTIADEKLFSGSWDNSIKIWDIETGECLKTLIGHKDWIRDLTFFHGKLLSGSKDRSIKIWDIETGKCLNTIDSKNTIPEFVNSYNVGAINSLVFVDETLFLTYDNFIKIMDFSAPNVEIFGYIALLFSTHGKSSYVGDQPIEGFSKLPQKAKEKIYGELYKIIKPRLTNDYWRCAEHAFHGQHEQWATGLERAQAIQNYLATEKELEQSTEPPTQPLLEYLGIVTVEEFSKKLRCRPEHLQKIGIISAEDLKILCSLSSDIQALVLEEDSGVEENFRDNIVKGNADNRKSNLSDLSQQLSLTVSSKIKETNTCGVLLYEGECPWIGFQNKLNAFRTKFDAIVLECKDLPKLTVEAFKSAKYNDLATELNALVSEFQTLDRDHQIAKLQTYINQWGILTAWTRRKGEGIQQSLKDLPESERTLQKLFQMGE